MNLKLKRRTLFFILVSATLISFQNCQMQANCNGSEASGSGACKSSSSSTNNGKQSASGVSRTPSSTAANSSSLVLGGGSSGSGSGSGGSMVLGGGSSGTGSGSGSSGSGSSNSGSTGVTCQSGSALKIVSQPSSKQVKINEHSELSVTLCGGSPPYTYQWYKDSKALMVSKSGPGLFCNTSYSCQIYSDRYSFEGYYKVQVKDSKGNTIESQSAKISIIEPEIGCTSGGYIGYKGPSSYFPDLEYGDLFENSRGKFILSRTDQNISPFMSDPERYNFSSIPFNFRQAKFAEKVMFTGLCRVQIPKINSPTPNPSCSYSGWDSNCSSLYEDTAQYKMTGGVTLECANNKWRLVDNTCAWQQQTGPNPDPIYNGNGGNGL